MQPQLNKLKKTNMKKFKDLAEQHSEKGRFKPVVPKMVRNTSILKTRSKSDSADVKLREDFDICQTCQSDPCICDESHGFINETQRMSAAVKLQRAFQREQQKSEASRKRAEELMKPKQEPVKQVKEAKDEEEYGYEGDMAMNQLETVIRHATYLKDMLKPDTDLPEWVQSKITLAQDYIQTACDYMTSEMNEGHQVVATTKQGETFKSGIHPTKEKALSQHYKMAKSGNFKKIDTVKTEEVQQVDEIVKPDVKTDMKTMDAQSFVKKHGVKKGQAKSMAESSMAEKQAQKQYRDARKDNPPFDPDPPKKHPVAVAGKYGQGYSTARHLARQAMSAAAKKYKSSIKEEGEISKKAQIVKDVAKKKGKTDAFNAEPIISKTEVKM
jgi:hypothetical protein